MNDPSTTLRTRRVEIARMIEALRAEDEELAIAEEVLGRLADGEPRPRHAPHAIATPRARAADDPPKSQRELVLDALAASPTAWLRTRDIITVANKRWGVAIPEKSLRPLLSVLKNARQIVRQGRVVALPERVSARATNSAPRPSRRRA